MPLHSPWRLSNSRPKNTVIRSQQLFYLFSNACLLTDNYVRSTVTRVKLAYSCSNPHSTIVDGCITLSVPPSLNTPSYSTSVEQLLNYLHIVNMVGRWRTVGIRVTPLTKTNFCLPRHQEHKEYHLSDSELQNQSAEM